MDKEEQAIKDSIIENLKSKKDNKDPSRKCKVLNKDLTDLLIVD